MKAFSLWEIVIHGLFVLNSESLGFFVGNSPPIIFFMHHFPSIWLENSKSNGGQHSKSLHLNPLSPLRIGLILKSPSPKSPQRQRYPFGPNLCQAQSLGPKLRPKSHFLQIWNTRPISKGPKSKLQKPCPNLQTQMTRKKTQPPVLHSNKMKTCVMDSHTLPLSNGISRSIVKSLYFRELKGSKISKLKTLQITVDRFIEASKEEIKQGSKWTDYSKFDRLARISRMM